MTGKVCQSTYEYIYLALCILKGIIERFPVLVTVTLHSKLLFLKDWKALLKNFLCTSFPWNRSKTQWTDSLHSHMNLPELLSMICLFVWVYRVVQKPEDGLSGEIRKQSYPTWGEIWDAPTGWCIGSQDSFYFAFLTAQRTDNPPKSSTIKFCCQDMAGRNTNTQIIEDGLDPVHGRNQGLGVLFCGSLLLQQFFVPEESQTLT